MIEDDWLSLKIIEVYWSNIMNFGTKLKRH